MKKVKFNPATLMSRLAVVSAISVMVIFSSCSDDDDETPAPAPTFARVMVTHASPDAPGVDLLVDNVKLNTAALTYPNSTPYITVFSGNRNIKVNVGGTSTTVIDATLPLAANKNYSVFAIDEVASISALAIEDNL